MKQLLSLFTLFLFSTLSFATPVAITNSSFETVLVSHGHDTDGLVNGYMEDTDILAVTLLNFQSEPTLTGHLDLEDFTNLQHLVLQFTNINSFSTANLTSLETLSLRSNLLLLNVDITTNTNLYFLGLNGDGIQSIDLSQNVNITTFNCNFSQLAYLDLSHNINITWMEIYDNSLLEKLKLHTDVGSGSSSCQVARNPNLFCIEVNDIALAIDNFNNLIWYFYEFSPLPPFSLSCPTIPPVESVTITPSLLQLAQLSTTQINTLTGMTPGSLVWDTNVNCLKVYDGTNWNCL